MSGKLKTHKGKHSDICLSVIVHLLEDELYEVVNVPEDATGKWFFEEVCCKQGITQEREYFGLRYLEHDLFSPVAKHWIDLSKTVQSQLKNNSPCVVTFRIKHYPSDPLVDFRLPKSLFLLYHQLRRDLAKGRLIATTDKLVRMSALILQIELGDCSMQDDPTGYLSQFKVLHNQTEHLESLIYMEHERLEGVLPAEAAAEMIELASSLETYGIDPVRVKTKAYGMRHIHLGLTHQGVAEFVSNRRQKLYPWSTITSMACDGKLFIVTIVTQSSLKRKKTTHNIRFKCDNKSVARALWEWASDRKLFFTLNKSSSVKPIKSKGGLFSRTHTFTFSGRCRREVLGRPAFISSMPSNMSINSSCNMTSDNMSISNQTVDSTNTAPYNYSVSMVNNLNTTGRSMTAIDEEQSADDLDPHGSSKVLSYSAQSHLSALSEPIVRKESTLMNDFELGGVANQSESSAIRQTVADHLVGLFTHLPRHRYTQEAKLRQQKILKQKVREGLCQRDHLDLFDTDDDEDESEQVKTENLVPANSSEMTNARATTPNSPKKMLVTFFKSLTARFSRARDNGDPNDSRTVVDDSHNTVDHQPNADKDVTVVSRPSWHVVALSTGVLSGLLFIGLILLLETDVSLPILTTIRGHPVTIEFYSNLYRPLRSLLFGFWRH